MSKHPWHRLSSVFCVYKPTNMSFAGLRKSIRHTLTLDLNETVQHTPANYVSIEGSTASELEVNTRQKLSHHPLAVGSLYEDEDLHLISAGEIGHVVSGIHMIGINQGTSLATAIKNARLVKTFQLSGILGYSTDDFYDTGKIVEKSTFTHVNPYRLNKVLMVIQAGHQKTAFELLGLDLQSQKAYELLSEGGLVRPSDDSHGIFYTLKCIHFKPPHFTIEINCINQEQSNLIHLIHEIGLLLKTNASTVKMRCVRFGPFKLQHALLMKHWRLEHILSNMEEIKPLLENVIPDTSSLVLQKDA